MKRAARPDSHTDTARGPCAAELKAVNEHGASPPAQHHLLAAAILKLDADRSRKAHPALIPTRQIRRHHGSGGRQENSGTAPGPELPQVDHRATKHHRSSTAEEEGRRQQTPHRPLRRLHSAAGGNPLTPTLYTRRDPGIPHPPAAGAVGGRGIPRINDGESAATRRFQKYRPSLHCSGEGGGS